MPVILIVEDEYAMRVALEDAFKHSGYDVVAAPDGETGLKLANERKPDLIILDVLLPDVSGLEVCRNIRSGGNRVPILMLTSF